MSMLSVRSTLTDFECSSDFFGNYNTPEVINTTDNTCRFHISFSFSAGCKASLVQREVAARRADGGIVFVIYCNPPVSSADSPLVRGGLFSPTIILQITLLVFVNTRDLYALNQCVFMKVTTINTYEVYASKGVFLPVVFLLYI